MLSHPGPVEDLLPSQGLSAASAPLLQICSHRASLWLSWSAVGRKLLSPGAGNGGEVGPGLPGMHCLLAERAAVLQVA